MSAALAMGGLAALQLVNGLHQAELISRQSQIQSQVNELNAKYAELDAWNQQNSALSQINVFRTKMDEQLATQDVVMASSNMDTSFGTAAEIKSESKLNAFLNTLDLQTQARTAGTQLRQQARSLRMNSQFSAADASMRANSTKMGAVLSAGSTLASGYNSGAFGGK